MSTRKFPHYNQILQRPFYKSGLDIVYKHSVFQIPRNEYNGWPIDFPDLTNDPNTVYIMHFQDSQNFINGISLELTAIENYFADLSNRVVVIHEEIDLKGYYSGPLNLLWFPSFVYEMDYQMRPYQHRWDHYIDTVATTNWQCLNGIPKVFRRKTAHYLRDNFHNGILSLGGGEIPLPHHDYDDVYYGKGNDNPQNFCMLDWVYSDCAINIVTETLYYNRPGIITEKTLFAFLAGQVPIIIAHQGFVKECEKMGFDMFTDIVNTDYDDLPDIQRWRAALESNSELLRTGIDRSQVKKRLIQNKDHALNHWPQYLIEQYTGEAYQLIENKFKNHI